MSNGSTSTGDSCNAGTLYSGHMATEYYTVHPSPLGDIVICGTEDALTYLNFADVMSEYPRVEENNDLAAFSLARSWLDAYFAGENPERLPSLAPRGTAFRETVWEILRQIPYGHIVTYGQIAAEIAAACGIEKMAAQAVGGAVGANPISLMIPCHRVVGVTGQLTGYGGGIQRKEALLALEREGKLPGN